MILTTDWFHLPGEGKARVLRTDWTSIPYAMCAVVKPWLPKNVIRLERHSISRVLLTQELGKLDLED